MVFNKYILSLFLFKFNCIVFVNLTSALVTDIDDSTEMIFKIQVTEELTICSSKQIINQVTLDKKKLSHFVYNKHYHLTWMDSLGTAIYNSTQIFLFKSSNIFESWCCCIISNSLEFTSFILSSHLFRWLQRSAKS